MHFCSLQREEIIELGLSTDELADATLGTNSTQDFDLSVDLDSIDMNDVAPPKIKLSDAKFHASLLSSSLLETLYVLVLMKLLVLKS